MHRPGRPPTLKEIAERADVHVSTVSRVLRQPEPVDGWSPSALRVREIAEELGYQRNLSAASLRTRRTNTIGVVMPRLTDGVVATVFQGVEATATRLGYSVLMSSPPDDLEAQRNSIELLLGRQVDGLLLSGLHDPGRPFVESLSIGRVPVVAVTRHADAGLPFVGSDDAAGGALMARHFLSHGLTDVAVIAGPEHATTARDRLAGFVAEFGRNSLTLEPSRICHSTFDVEGGVEAGRKLLESPDRPRAIFAVTDTIALGVMGIARDLGLSIPEDVALAGFNDIPVVAQLPVPLTTVRSPAFDIGAAAVRMLLDPEQRQESQAVRLPVELVVRRTA